MIPILYREDETDFANCGIGALSEATDCTVTEERNGSFECRFRYPVEGRLYAYIKEDCIIKAKPNETSEPQLFRVYASSKPIGGMITYDAEHISYELSKNPIESAEAENETAQEAINTILSAALISHRYTGQSDITTRNSTVIDRQSVRAALGGTDGSVLSVWGGEFEFDNFTVKLHRQRGRETGIRIAYGKNLTDIRQDTNIADMFTAVYPYARYTPMPEGDSTEQPDEITVSLPEKILYSQRVPAGARVRVCLKDFTENFSGVEEITVDQLREKAQAWMETSGFDVPTVSITVSFENLWQSPEYAQLAPLERCSLCDTVTVVFQKLNISATAKIIKTVYDTLNEKYTSITIGSAKANFADTVNQTSAAIEQTKQEIKKQSSAIEVDIRKAVDEATKAITGQSGGYVVLNPPKNPQEILIMDKPDIAAALKVWRWNSGGLGYSRNGYNGPFETAITQDGEIIADFITAGTLRAIETEACTIKGGSININNRFVVTPEGDATVTGKITATSGTIGGCTIESGILKIKAANISEKLTAEQIDVQGVITAGGIAVKGDVTAEAERATEAEGALSSRITANAESISAEVKRATDAEGSLSTQITATADGLSAEITRAQGAESTLSSRITANAESISAEVARSIGADSSLSTRISANAESISAEVTRAQGAEGSLSSRITANAESISAEVERATDAESSLSASISATAESISAEVIRAQGAESTLSSRITANAESISAEVIRAQGAESTLSSRITANAESISAEVERATDAESSLSASISATAESISAEVIRAQGAESTLSSRITANATEIAAKVSASGGTEASFAWSLTTAGFTLKANNTAVMNVDADGLEVTGKITATSGSLENLTIAGKLFFGGDQTYYINANYNDSSYYLYLPGLRIDKASGAVFSGKLSAPSGTIGGFTIDGDSIKGSGVGLCGKAGQDYAFWAGGDDSAAAPFRVGHDGTMRATNASLSGTFENISGNWGLRLISNRMEFLQNGTTVSVIQGSSGYYNAQQTATVNCVNVSSAVRIGGDLLLGGNLGFSDGISFYMNGTRCLCGWIKYQKSLTDARYMRFVNGLLVGESNEIWDGDYLGQIN